MRINTFINPDPSHWSELVKRPSLDDKNLLEATRAVFEDVERRGDQAVLDYTERFDGIRLDSPVFQALSMDELESVLEADLRASIRVAYTNIRAFHEAQQRGRLDMETMPGVRCWMESRPIERVGLYIPGGTAPLFSTVLMLAIPAQLAGCSEIALCTPPAADGRVHPAMQYAARLCGLEQWYTVGGMQAIAALAMGTASIPKVDKLFGPGNQYVTSGKRYAQSLGVAIDMPAGPSELLILADDSARADFLAADLLSQAEHGADSQVVLVCLSPELIDRVQESLMEQLQRLPRKGLAEGALANSRAISFNSPAVALAFVNAYAPEHLIIQTRDDDYFADGVQHAGSVFLGPYSPESAGDYASGTNHTLPTAGYARAYSGVHLQSYMKQVTFQRISKEGLQRLGPHIEHMAEAEELSAHKEAVSIRLRALQHTTGSEFQPDNALN